MREGSALRRRRCAFLNDQKGTKESPGDGSDERLRGAGAHSHLVPTPSGPSGHLPLTGGVGPGPLITKVGHFGLFVISGGQNQDRFPSYSQATGPFCY